MNINEKCGCGAEVSISIIEEENSKGENYIRQWRRGHPCQLTRSFKKTKPVFSK